MEMVTGIEGWEHRCGVTRSVVNVGHDWSKVDDTVECAGSENPGIDRFQRSLLSR
jgi:hypothetical protein